MSSARSAHFRYSARLRRPLAADPAPGPSPLHAHSPSPSPLAHHLALLTRLAEDNHQLIRRLTQDLEQVTRRNALLVEQLLIALEMAAR